MGNLVYVVQMIHDQNKQNRYEAPTRTTTAPDNERIYDFTPVQKLSPIIEEPDENKILLDSNELSSEDEETDQEAEHK